MNGGETEQGKRRNHENLRDFRPMDGVAALYCIEQGDAAEALLSSLSQTIFDEPEPLPAHPIQQLLAGITYRVAKRTTTRHKSEEGGHVHRNRLLERSNHPYALTLLASSSLENQTLVEGGDPMNGPYMMMIPEIRKNATLWDKLFFSSVQGRDVQLRFLWETRATYEQAKMRADKGRPVRLKALAAGTGLSMILAYDRLVRDGAENVTCEITDRDPGNSEKTNRLIEKLAGRRNWRTGPAGITAHPEDIFAEASAGIGYDVVTAVGILEYLQGYTCDTTERRHGLPELEEEQTALHLAEKLSAMSADDACVIVNSYRPHHTTRLLELFGKKFDYREITELDALLKAGGFRLSRKMGSAVIYDVGVYEKAPLS